ncbi:MAG: ABC transporter permease [Pseudomonadota bacterium]
MNYEIIDISYFGLALGFTLLTFVLLGFYKLKINIISTTLLAFFRMTVQLFLIGIFFEYLFQYNNALINITWFLVMIVVASFAFIIKTDINFKVLIIPSLSAMILVNFAMLLYFNCYIIGLENIFDAKYIIAVGGMLLGNILRGNIIGLSKFYNLLTRNSNRYNYYLSCGASTYEICLPYFREALTEAMNPFIATIATMGIVALPGMMTGQILSGISPLTAIKYQIAIVIAIFISSILSISLTILFSLKNSIEKSGVLQKSIFKQKP